ncbi:chemotaxis protein CheW [Shewanella xiamenensis]|uniref:chemotaxis protein CheW n=1 Tax=Shewanella xiamenensis TaxID=332186 RepID=UPI0011857EA1|nr:chemotaxis protein CheW [Shewanella xiamenensis]TVL24596.1 chemotaxis protein CheW [Shewanella xiamenensis]TVL24842.1 chemotaxis protein CheW [Shewanella xiamenensis]TVL29588.1 chemotaxis protein CheW [Shewanella xiamenensis]TVL38650.1 chemotaxis protein CheW [Shewanella xiamenensis]TVP05721.1 chemotaxis protein CheW [Shewanella xiamenensis]
MSKSVDETVFDFFELLLHEDDSAFGASPIKSQENIATAFDSSKKMETQQLNNAILAEHERSKADVKATLEPEVQPIRAKSIVTVSSKESAEPLVNKQSLERLLAPVLKAEATVVDKPTEVIEQPLPAPKQPVVITVAEVDETADVAPTQVDNLSTVSDTQVGFAPPSVTKDLQEVLDDEFQVLFFKVAGLTLAVPLVSLGGIVKVERINHIIGRPSWFLGVQTHREEQLNLVDTCAWVMPEKYTDKLAQSVNYQYLVLLEGSNWGLACESLLNAVKITKSQVNWRSKAGKRPWLAGVVKEQMCGILHVQALVEMLDAGLGCQDSIG